MITVRWTVARSLTRKCSWRSCSWVKSIVSFCEIQLKTHLSTIALISEDSLLDMLRSDLIHKQNPTRNITWVFAGPRSRDERAKGQLVNSFSKRKGRRKGHCQARCASQTILCQFHLCIDVHHQTQVSDWWIICWSLCFSVYKHIPSYCSYSLEKEACKGKKAFKHKMTFTAYFTCICGDARNSSMCLLPPKKCWNIAFKVGMKCKLW